MKRKKQSNKSIESNPNFELTDILTKYAYVEFSNKAVPLGNPNRKPIKNGHLLPTNPNRTEALGLISISTENLKFLDEK